MTSVSPPLTLELERFFNASALLNGMAPTYGNQAEPYYAALKELYGIDALERLVSICLAFPDDEQKRNEEVASAGLDEVANSVVRLWYTGSVKESGDLLDYTGTLAWKAYAEHYDPAQSTLVSTLCGGPFGFWSNPVGAASEGKK